MSSCAWPPRPGTRCGSCRRRPACSSWARPPSRASPARRCWSTSSSPIPPAAPSPATRRPTTTRSRHLELVRRADVFAVAPASANTLAKLAGGLADNLLTQRRAGLHRAAGARARDEQPHVGAPGHARQPGAPAPRGARSWSPRPGRWPPRGEWGAGRLAEPADVLAAIEAVLAGGSPSSLDGLRVLVTAGGTREPIDSVRYVGNRSSGRMGVALAAEAAARGAPRSRWWRPTLAVPVPAGVRAWRSRRPPSCATPRGRVRRRGRAADGRRRGRLPARRAAPTTRSRRRARRPRRIELEPTDDVLAALSARRAGRPDAGGLRRRARRRAAASAPAQARAQGPRRRGAQRHRPRRTSASTPSDNEVTLITADGERAVPMGSKARRGGCHPRRGGKAAGPRRSSCVSDAAPRSAASWSTTCSRRGSALLESGDFAAATVPLERARDLEPDKTSIREALGRAYFRSGRFEQAREEFAAVVEQAPGQRLRPLLPGQGAGEHRPPRRRPPPRRPGRLDAARPRRLPRAARPLRAA